MSPHPSCSSPSPKYNFRNFCLILLVDSHHSFRTFWSLYLYFLTYPLQIFFIQYNLLTLQYESQPFIFWPCALLSFQYWYVLVIILCLMVIFRTLKNILNLYFFPSSTFPSSFWFSGSRDEHVRCPRLPSHVLEPQFLSHCQRCQCLHDIVWSAPHLLCFCHRLTLKVENHWSIYSPTAGEILLHLRPAKC